MQPRAQTSALLPYCLLRRMISGARQNLLMTHTDCLLGILWSSSFFQISSSLILDLNSIYRLLRQFFYPFVTNLYCSILVSSKLFCASLYSASTLDRPKSHMNTWQLSFKRMFSGFKSRWRTSNEWMKLIAQSMLYIKVNT